MYRKIGKWRPTYMNPGDSYEGVFYDNGLLAAFKMQCVQKWDAVGRDVDYCAFAFMGYDVVGRFDFDALLALEAFSVPTRTPGRSVEYNGPCSQPYSVSDAIGLRDARVSDRIDFRSIGDMLEKCGRYCPEWMFGRTSFNGARTVFAETESWIGEPPQWAHQRVRKKAKFQKLSLNRIRFDFGGNQ